MGTMIWISSADLGQMGQKRGIGQSWRVRDRKRKQVAEILMQVLATLVRPPRRLIPGEDLANAKLEMRIEGSHGTGVDPC